MNEDKAKKYDSTHGKDAYYYRHTKSGQAQSKTYDSYFGMGKKKASKSKALDKAKKSKYSLTDSHFGGKNPLDSFPKTK